MILQPIDFVVYTWLVVAVQSVAYVGWDLRSSGLPGDLNGRDVNGVGAELMILSRPQKPGNAMVSINVALTESYQRFWNVAV